MILVRLGIFAAIVRMVFVDLTTGTPSNGKGCLGGNLPPPGLPQDPCPIGDYR